MKKKIVHCLSLFSQSNSSSSSTLSLGHIDLLKNNKNLIKKIRRKQNPNVCFRQKKKHTYVSHAQNLGKKKNINDSYQWQTMINLLRNKTKKPKINNISIIGHFWSLLSPRHIHSIRAFLNWIEICAHLSDGSHYLTMKLVFPLGEAKHWHFDKRSIQPCYFP